MTLDDDTVDVLLIVGPVACKGGDWIGDLVKQRLNLRAIIDIMGRQL
jgi:hypothetical protein